MERGAGCMAPNPLRRRFISLSTEATELLAESLGRGLSAGSVLALDGELGAGKTAFIRGLARGLEVLDQVSSPTFTLMMEHEGRLPFFHFDAWMAGREALFLDGGGADYLGSEGVCAIEWAARVERYLPALRLGVRLGHRSPEERLIEIELLGAGTGTALEACLAESLAAHAAGEQLVELSWESGEPSQVPGVEYPE
jgi:tRNA threonylcarbamoyladenosine biosynthesis protein TsaE